MFGFELEFQSIRMSFNLLNLGDFNCYQDLLLFKNNLIKFHLKVNILKQFLGLLKWKYKFVDFVNNLLFFLWYYSVKEISISYFIKESVVYLLGLNNLIFAKISGSTIHPPLNLKSYKVNNDNELKIKKIIALKTSH